MKSKTTVNGVTFSVLSDGEGYSERGAAPGSGTVEIAIWRGLHDWLRPSDVGLDPKYDRYFPEHDGGVAAYVPELEMRAMLAQLQSGRTTTVRSPRLEKD